MHEFQRARGLLHVENPLYLDVVAQVIELGPFCRRALTAGVAVEGWTSYGKAMR